MIEHAGSVDYNLRFSLNTFRNNSYINRISNAEQLVGAIEATIKHVKGLEATARIICNGKQHTISFRDGRLHLHDHTDVSIQQQYDMHVLGGDFCRCLKIRHAWRIGRLSDIPKPLSEARKLTKTLTAWRSLLVDREPPHHTSSHHRPKWLKAIEHHVKRCFRSCDYKIIHDRKGHVLVWSGGYTEPDSYGGRITNPWLYPQFGVCLRLSPDWPLLMSHGWSTIKSKSGEKLFVLALHSFPEHEVKKKWAVALIVNEMLIAEYGPHLGMKAVRVRPHQHELEPDWRKSQVVYRHGSDGLTWREILQAQKCPV